VQSQRDESILRKTIEKCPLQKYFFIKEVKKDDKDKSWQRTDRNTGSWKKVKKRQ
jgi:hypothetical protein